MSTNNPTNILSGQGAGRLLILATLFCLLLTGALAREPVLDQVPELDEILAEHFEAAAMERMEKIESIVTTGTNIYSMGGIESSFTIYQARPGLIRVEGNFQGSEVIQTYNGEQGWIYAPGLGIPQPREVTGEELDNLLNQAEFGSPLWKHREDDRHLELLDPGEETPDPRIRMITPDGDEVIFTLDAESYLIKKVTSRQVMGGAEAEVEVEIKDYKKVRGIPVSHYMVTRMNGDAVSTIQIEKVSFNKKLEPSLFERPRVE